MRTATEMSAGAVSAAGAAGAAGDECESDLIKEAAIQSQERALVPLIEDAAEWLSKVTG